MSKTEEAKKDIPTSKKKESPGNPVLNALLGIIALVLIVFFSNWLFSLSSIGNATLDLTEDKVHTLTPGTKAILGELKESCLLYTSPSPRDQRGSRMPSSA